MKAFLKKHSMKILLLIAIVIGGAALYMGCNVEGATVDTKLVLDNDMSGVRQMTVTIPQKTFDKYISATWTELATTLINNCPTLLTCTTEESNAEYKFNFELEFDTIEDYKTMVELIIGNQVNISVDTPENVFADGIVIQENFSSVQLLAWITDRLSEAGYIKNDNADKLLSAGANIVEYDGIVYDDLREYIFINSMKDLEIKQITINTFVTIDRTFDREIIIEFPEKTMERNGEEIKAYLNNNLLEGIEGKWKKKSRTYTFSASVKDKSIELIQSFTARLFADENCVVFYEDSSESGDILDILMNYREELSFGAFSEDGSGKTPVSYNFNIEDIDEVSVEAKIDNKDTKNFTVETKNDYASLVDDDVNSMKLIISMHRHYNVKHVLATTKVDKYDKVIRSYVFVLSKMPTQFERELIDTKLRKATEQYAMLETEIIDNEYCFTVTLEGTEDSVSSSYLNVFGNQGDFNHYMGADNESLVVNERIDFSNYLSIAEDTLLTYTLTVDGARFDEDSFRLSDTTVRDIDIKGDTVRCEVYGTEFDMTVNGGHNDSTMAWIILLVIAAVMAVVSVGVIGVVKMNKTKINKV